MSINKKEVRKEVRYPFRSLDNYKSMHRETARARGVLEAFMACRTLTAARRLLFG